LIFEPETFFFLAVETAVEIGCTQIGRLKYFPENDCRLYFAPPVLLGRGERGTGCKPPWPVLSKQLLD
jgi:hypothetical protein